MNGSYAGLDAFMMTLYGAFCIALYGIAIALLRKRQRSGFMVLATAIVVSIPAYQFLFAIGSAMVHLLGARDL